MNWYVAVVGHNLISPPFTFYFSHKIILLVSVRVCRRVCRWQTLSTNGRDSAELVTKPSLSIGSSCCQQTPSNSARHLSRCLSREGALRDDKVETFNSVVYSYFNKKGAFFYFLKKERKKVCVWQRWYRGGNAINDCEFGQFGLVTGDVLNYKQGPNFPLYTAP